MTLSVPAQPITAIDIAEQIPHVRLAGQSRNLQIQWLRAMAALMVVLFHASVFQPRAHLAIFDDSFRIFGVALFFAISGYLMSVAIARQNAFVFLAHRVVRIYPIFLIICALYYGVTRLIKPAVPIDFSALSLIPVDSADYPLAIEWTLVFEISFYVALFVAGLVGMGRHIVLVAAAWLGFLAVVSWHAPEHKLVLNNIYKVAEDVAMAAGLMVPWLARRKLPPVLLIAIGLLGFWPFYYCVTKSEVGCYWVAGILTVTLVTGVVRLAQNNPAFGDNHAGRAIAKIGDYSYALYLVHSPVMRLLKRTDFSNDFIWIAGIAIAFILAILFGRLDIWLYGHLKRVVNGAQPRLRQIAVTIFVFIYAWIGGSVVYAWYAAKDMQVYADTMIPRLTISPEAAGLVPSDRLRGVVDRIAWENGALIVQGWAIDLSHSHNPVALAFYQDGKLLGVATAMSNRPDVNAAYHTHMLSAYRFRVDMPCSHTPVTILLFTKTAYMVSENTQTPLTCP